MNEERDNLELSDDDHIRQLHDAIESAANKASDIDAAKGLFDEDYKTLVECFADVERKYWHVGLSLHEAVPDPQSIANDMLYRYEEFAPLREVRDQIDFIWRLTAWRSKNRIIYGTARKRSKREIALEPGAIYEMNLNLPVWMALDEHQRCRLVHHELMHILGFHGYEGAHEIEEFGATLQRFGIGDAYQAKALASFGARPSWEAEVRLWGYDPISGQGLLFGDGVKVEVPSNAPVLTVSTTSQTVSITAEQAARAVERLKRL